jgi:hypothetical protein
MARGLCWKDAMSEPLIVPLPEPDAQRRLGTCARGFSDRFGDRLLTIDRETATPLELLRFKPELSDSPAFESGLRERVERAQVQSLAVAAARSVERWNGGLVLVSRNAAGRRLSETSINGRGVLMALDFLRQVTPALAALAEANGGFGHGALTLDRVVATPDGRLTVVEHPLGRAVESLAWPAARLQAELGLAVPPAATPQFFDSRIDPIQLGFVALSLVLGRRVDAAEYPNGLAKLLDECAEIKAGDRTVAPRLRAWLERALQVGAKPFETASEALAALGELPSEADLTRRDPPAPVAAAVPKPAVVVPIAPPAPRPVPAAAAPPVMPKPVPAAAPSWGPPSGGPAPAPANRLRQGYGESAGASAQAEAGAYVAPAASSPLPAPALSAPVEPAVLPELEPPAVAPPPARPRTARPWALIAMTVVALAEAAVIAGQWYRAPAPALISAPVEAAAPAAVVTQTPERPADVARAATGPKSVVDLPSDPPAPPAAPAASGAPRIGGVTFVSPLELQIFEGGKRIGASGGPIAILEGSHSVELVNESLGFRARETVTIRPGEMLSRTVPVPSGRISINATPWADVWIDGNAAGQTPLANVSLPIGEHQIVFRHPQFGEQRQTALVKVEGVTRLSVGFQR